MMISIGLTSDSGPWVEKLLLKPETGNYA